MASNGRVATTGRSELGAAVLEVPDDGGCSPASRIEYRTRWVYFCLFIWLQSSGRFMSLYYLDKGLSHAEIGAVFATGSLLTPVGAMLTGHMADRCALSRGPVARLYIFAACIFVGTVVFLLQAVPWPGVPVFTQMLTCNALLFPARSAACGLLDAITLQALRDRQLYGKERLFGAYGFALMGLLIGIMLEWFGFGILHICKPLCAVAVLAALARTGEPPINVDRAQHSVDRALAEPENSRTNVSLRLSALIFSYASSAAKIGFFIYAFTLAVGTAIVENLTFLYFRDLNASYIVCGLSVTVTVLFEIPLFARSKQLLERFGPRGCLVIAGLCYSFRVVGYTLVPSGAWILAFEPMHGTTYAFRQTANVEIMASITPCAFIATGQAVLGCVSSLGSFCGTFGAGQIIERYGEAMCYRSAALFVGLGLSVFILLNTSRFSNFARGPGD